MKYVPISPIQSGNNVKNKNIQVVEGKVIITKTVEDILTKEDMMVAKLNMQRQADALKAQSVQIKAEYENIMIQIAEADELIFQLSESSKQEQGIETIE